MIYYFKDLILLLIIIITIILLIYLKNETRTNIQEQKENKKDKLNYLL
jgi:cell division protein FtsL